MGGGCFCLGGFVVPFFLNVIQVLVDEQALKEEAESEVSFSSGKEKERGGGLHKVKHWRLNTQPGLLHITSY